jgi:PAS domain S-box-containing protein
VALAVLLALLLGALVVLGRRCRRAEEMRQRCHEALEAAADGFFALDRDQRLSFVSPRTARLFGYEPRELLGRPLELLFPPQRRAARRGAPAGDPGQSTAPGLEGELTGVRKDGSELAVEARLGPPLPVEGGWLITPLFVRDVTRSKHTREMLRPHEAHLKIVVEQMPAILWTTDTRLRITSTLGAGLATLQVRPEELIGLSMLECLDNDDVESTPITAHLKAVGGESLSYEMGWKGRTFQVRVERTGRVVGVPLGDRPRRHRAAAAGGAIPAGAEDGGGRQTGRRHCPRLQQPAVRHPRL